MKFLINGVLCLATLAALLVATPEAQAQSRGRGRGGDVGSYGGPRYDYYRGGGWYGRASWGGSYGYYPSWGYSYYPRYYGSFYGYSPSSYRDYYPRTYYYSSYPTTYEAYPTTTYQSYYPAVQTTSTARITVRVPDANAEVWFNGVATQQRGTDRVFETPALSGGYRHTYEIRVRWTGADGQMRDRTRTVEVQPGQDMVVDF